MKEIHETSYLKVISAFLSIIAFMVLSIIAIVMLFMSAMGQGHLWS